jgi:MFS family permease
MRQYMWLARSRPIRLLLLAWGISYAGDLAAFTVASVYLYGMGGAGYVGLLWLEYALFAVLLVPLISSWADRVRRERLLAATLIPRALLLGAAGAAMSGHGQAMLVAVLVAVDGGLCSVFRPVQAALLPWLARTPDELTSANTAASVMQAAAMLGGPAIAAGLLSAGPPQSAMFATCGIVAAGAVLLAGVRPLAAQVPAQAAKIFKQLRLDMAAGFTACIRQRGALALVVPAAAQTFARGVLSVLTVVIALDLFGLGPAGVGLLGAALGAGGILGTPLAVVLVRGKRVARCFCAGVAGWGVPMILLAFTHARYWAYLLFGAVGVANLIDDVAVYSALQRVIPPRRMGRALGARRAVLLLSAGLGSAVAPPLIHAFGARATLAGVGLLVIATATGFVPSLKAIDSRLSAPGPQVALLRQVSFFGPLPFATVEHLASVLRSATYEPGDVIIREADPGECFYLIAAGRARASKDGRQLSEMGAADSFGEIALLRPIPRTATVTTISRMQVWVLDREEFLAAVTGSPESGESADAVVSARLRVG